MKSLELPKCNDCNGRATQINGKIYEHCLEHMEDSEIADMRRRISSGRCSNSVLDGSSTVEIYPYRSLGFNVPAEADFKGSIFIRIDFSSQDLTRVDFSFCFFESCDFRRTRLFNSSLFWAVFNKSLLRQTDINNSDCRWMRASAINKSCLEELRDVLTRLESMKQANLVHLIGRDWGSYFFRRFRLVPNDKDEEVLSFFREGKYQDIVSCISNNHCAPSENGVSLCSTCRVQTCEATDWSGSSLRACDFAHANFDGAKIHESSFDSSDLFDASFCHADLQRCTFADASFSRADKNKPNRSNFEETILEECMLRGTNLTGLYFRETRFAYSDFGSAHFDDAVFFKCDMRSIDAAGVIANRCRFYCTDLSGSSFLAATLNDATFYLESDASTGLMKGGNEERRLLEDYPSQQDQIEDRRSKIVAANFRAAELKNVNMTCVAAQAVDLQAANLTGANFREAQCAGAQLSASSLEHVDFTEANLDGCDMRDADIGRDVPIFKNTILKRAILSGMDLVGVQFVDCAMEGITMAECDLSKVIIRATNPSKPIKMKRSSLRNSQITGLQCEYVDLDLSNLSYVMTDKSSLEGSFLFTNCYLTQTNLEGSSFANGKFNKCTIEKSNLANSRILKVDFYHCNLDSCSFSASTLKDVNIILKTGSHLSAVDFSEATLTECAIAVDKCGVKSNVASTAVNLQRAESNGLILNNITFSSLQAGFSSIQINKSENVVFEYADFSSGNLRFFSVDKVNFFHCKFQAAAIKMACRCPEKMPAVFLGCSFVETGMMSYPQHMIFADCDFVLLSIFSDAKSAVRWAKAILIANRYKDLKYSGFSVDKNIFKTFISNYYNTILNRQGSIHETFQHLMAFDAAKRFDSLIPSEIFSNVGEAIRLKFAERQRRIVNDPYLSERERLKFGEQLCRGLKIDFKNQNIFDLAKQAHIEERLCEIKLEAPGTWRWIRPLLSWIAKVPSWGVLLICLLYFIIVFFLIPICSIFAIASIIVPLGFCLASRFCRDLASRHIYQHGESSSRLLFSAISIIGIFALLYYGFLPLRLNTSKEDIASSLSAILDYKMGDNGVPVRNDQNISYSTCPANLCVVLDSSIGGMLNPAVMQDGNTIRITGGMKNGDQFLTRSTSFDWESLLTCAYFSTVTFTTLGYGDIVPQGVVRLLVMLEASFGAFLMALFVFAYTRRDN